MVVAGLAISFALVNMHDGCVFEILRELLLLPHRPKEVSEARQEGWAARLEHLSRDGVRAGDFPEDICLKALATSSADGGMSRSGLVATWGRRVIASSLMDDGRFSTLLKCSAHLSRIWPLSVSRAVPSALRRGDAEVDGGP